LIDQSEYFLKLVADFHGDWDWCGSGVKKGELVGFLVIDFWWWRCDKMFCFIVTSSLRHAFGGFCDEV
jgi:hypothetical protein